MFMFRDGRDPSASADAAPYPVKRAGWGNVGALADRLFAEKLAQPSADPLADAIVTVHGGDRSLLASDPQEAVSLAEAAAALSAICANDRVLVINLDGFASLDAAVTALMAFRQELPDVAVVIASRRFQRDEFSPERRAIADVSLKLPASAGRLTLAIGQARRHNQDRLKYN